MSKRINYIDRIKGFTILMVVMGHLYLFLLHMNESFVFRFIASCHMHLFMFISGFVAYIPDERATPENLVRLQKRFLSYFCPNIFIPLTLIAWRSIVLRQGLAEAWDGNWGFWYLKSLAIYCIVHYLLLYYQRPFFRVTILLTVYCIFYWGWRSSAFLNNLFDFEHAVCFFPFYMMGYYFRKYDLTQVLQRHNWIFTIVLIGYSYLLYISIPFHAISLVVSRLVVPTCAVIVIYYLFLRRKDDNSQFESWLSYIGRNTLDIYIYHGFFMINLGIIDVTTLGTWAERTQNTLLCYIAALMLSVLFTYLSIWFGMLIRQSDILRKLIYGQFLIVERE